MIGCVPSLKVWILHLSEMTCYKIHTLIIPRNVSRMSLSMGLVVSINMITVVKLWQHNFCMRLKAGEQCLYQFCLNNLSLRAKSNKTFLH